MAHSFSSALRKIYQIVTIWQELLRSCDKLVTSVIFWAVLGLCSPPSCLVYLRELSRAAGLP